MSGSQRQSLIDSRRAAVRRASRIWAADQQRSLSTGSRSMSISSGSSPEVSQRNQGPAGRTEAGAGVGAGDRRYVQAGVHANDGLEAHNGFHAQGGVHVNGLHANGLHTNGLHAHGVYADGMYANGVFANGVSANGGYADYEEYANNEEHAYHGQYANGEYTNGVHANGVYSNGVHANGLHEDGAYANGGHANGVYANDENYWYDQEYTRNGTYADGAYTSGAYMNGVYANDEEHAYDREHSRNGTYANGAYTNGVYADDEEHAYDREYARNGTYANGAYTNAVHANDGEYVRDGAYAYNGYVMDAHDGSGADADDEMDGRASYEASDSDNQDNYTHPAPYQHTNRIPGPIHQWEGALDADRSLSRNHQDTDHFNDGLSVDQDVGIIPSIERSASASDDDDEYSEPDEDEDSDRNGGSHENGVSEGNREADDDGASNSNGELDDNGEPDEDGESDENIEVNVLSRLSSRFERAANRDAPNQAMSSEDGDSESDSEDVTVNYPPRRRLAYGLYFSEEAARQRLGNAAAAYEDEESDAADSEDGSGLDNTADFEHGSGSASGSKFSSLGPTPEPPDPELMRLEKARKLRERPLCTCEGWCSCIKYKAFYGHQQTSEGPTATGSGIDDDGIKDEKDENVEAMEDEAEGEDAEKNEAEGKGVEEGRFGEEPAANVPGEDEAPSSDVSAYQPFLIRDPAGLNLPSQTHLSERVLAGEGFPTSAIRTTLPPGERDDHTTAQLDDLGEQVFSWDQRARPRRPPVGWVGREWIGTVDRGEPTLQSESPHEEAGTRLEDASLPMALHGSIGAGTPAPLALQSGVSAQRIPNLEREIEGVDQVV